MVNLKQQGLLFKSLYHDNKVGGATPRRRQSEIDIETKTRTVLQRIVDQNKTEELVKLNRSPTNRWNIFGLTPSQVPKEPEQQRIDTEIEKIITRSSPSSTSSFVIDTTVLAPYLPASLKERLRYTGIFGSAYEIFTDRGIAAVVDISNVRRYENALVGLLVTSNRSLNEHMITTDSYSQYNLLQDIKDVPSVNRLMVFSYYLHLYYVLFNKMMPRGSPVK
jgi:hypothetical protein